MIADEARSLAGTARVWPDGGYTRIPYWVYSDPDIFRKEMEVLFAGPTWNFVALECELPKPGSFKRSWIGTRPVIVTRDLDGSVHVVENRCAHRGAQLCWKNKGEQKTLNCVYHQWTYNLRGDLLGLAFKKGALGKGGMPDDFVLDEHGLTKLRVTVRGGVVWASFDPEVVSFEDYCGAEVLGFVDRQFSGRPLQLLGYSRQRIDCNWKLYFENLKDPYHATLMHAFFVTFGLWRADSQSDSIPSNGHGVMLSRNEGKKTTAATGEMERFKPKFELEDKDTVTPVREFADGRVIGLTLFPGVVLHQQANTLAMRHLIPRSPTQMEVSWTFYGYADDPPEMTRLRLRHANLMGPAGFVSIDDSEVLTQIQFGANAYDDEAAVVEMGGRDVEPQDHMVTEVLIRDFYRLYRAAMNV